MQPRSCLTVRWGGEAQQKVVVPSAGGKGPLGPWRFWRTCPLFYSHFQPKMNKSCLNKGWSLRRGRGAGLPGVRARLMVLLPLSMWCRHTTRLSGSLCPTRLGRPLCPKPLPVVSRLHPWAPRLLFTWQLWWLLAQAAGPLQLALDPVLLTSIPPGPTEPQLFDQQPPTGAFKYL